MTLHRSSCCCGLEPPCNICDLPWKCSDDCATCGPGDRLMPLQAGSTMEMQIQMATSRVFLGTLPGGCDCTATVLMPARATMVLECDPNAGHIWVSQAQQAIFLPLVTSSTCDSTTCCGELEMDCDVVVRADCWIDGAVEVVFIPSSEYAADIAASNACIEYFRPFTFRGSTRMAYRLYIRLEDIAAVGAPSCKYLWQRAGSATLYGSWNGTQTDDTIGLFDYGPVIPLADFSAEAIGLTSSSTAEERYSTAFRYTDWCTTSGNYIRVDWARQTFGRTDECHCEGKGECDFIALQTLGPTYYGLDLQSGVPNACRCGYAPYTAAIKTCSGSAITITGSGNAGTRTVSQICVDDYWTLKPSPYDTTSTWTSIPGSYSVTYTAGQAASMSFTGPSEFLVRTGTYECYPCIPVCDRGAEEDCCETKNCGAICAPEYRSWSLSSQVSVSAVSCPVY